MNTKDRGDISEAQVAAAFLEQGWVVLKPYGDNQRYDLVTDRGSGFERVQVKTAWLKGDCLLFNCRSSGYHRGLGTQPYHGQIEIFGVWAPETRKVYVIPVGDSTVSTMSLRLKSTRNGQTAGIRFASDYELKSPTLL